MSETVRMVSPFGLPPTPKNYSSTMSEEDVEEANAEVRQELEEAFTEEVDAYLYEMARVGSGRLAIAFGVAPWGAAVVALSVVAGHNFSPYLRLGGGRGVATALGVSAVVVPIIAIVGLLVGALWFLRTRRIVGAGVSAFAVTNVLVVVAGAPAAVLAMCAAMSLLVLATHLGRAYLVRAYLGRAHLAALEVSAGRRR